MYRPVGLAWAEFSKRRARDSNSQPLAGHYISSVAASHSLTLQGRASGSIVPTRWPILKAEWAGKRGDEEVGGRGGWRSCFLAKSFWNLVRSRFFIPKF